MKKAVAGILALVFAFSFSACGGDSEIPVDRKSVV